jgi:hypothetical protein
MHAHDAGAGLARSGDQADADLQAAGHADAGAGLARNGD